MSDIKMVTWSKHVDRQLEKLPKNIGKKLYAWADLVRISGILAIRTHSGFHDEPLKGQRLGQRSIRLNRSYRAIYVEKHDGTLEFLEVIEVNKHDY